MGSGHLRAANQRCVYTVQCLLCSPSYVCCPKCRSCNRLLKSACALSWHSSLWHPSTLHLFTNFHIFDGICGCEKWEKAIKLEADAHSGSFNFRHLLACFLSVYHDTALSLFKTQWVYLQISHQKIGMNTEINIKKPVTEIQDKSRWSRI